MTNQNLFNALSELFEVSALESEMDAIKDAIELDNCTALKKTSTRNPRDNKKSDVVNSEKKANQKARMKYWRKRKASGKSQKRSREKKVRRIKKTENNEEMNP